ncbi:regulatory protein RecX [Arthrobacter castelli]|uniref:regulatory protein RecX n=1 Tax=Arthrobacter castelli TaxID=271431 RepID=UPI000409F1BC|nr:regulatory protein RecX [Arthrobacter castelli]
MASSRPDGPAAGSGGHDAVEPDPHEVARSIVLRQLTAAPKSRLQLQRKLAERDVAPDVAAAVLDRLEEVQLVDDAEFARMWVRSRAQTKGLAARALERELADKGITGDTAAEALGQLSADDELAAARSLVEAKLKTNADYTDRSVRDKHTRRLVAMLGRKGYSPSLAFQVVTEAIDALA